MTGAEHRGIAYASSCNTESGRVLKLRSLPRQVEAFKHFHQGQVLAVPEDDHLVWLFSQLAFDEAQEMLLVHAGTMMYMGVYLQHAGL